MTHGADAVSKRRPRVVVTGFGPFPGAPENPTEALIGALSARGASLPDCELLLEVLPVDYGAVPERLSAIARDFSPDIAVHFGLSAQARGFTLERLARNEIRAEKPDIRGQCGTGGPIFDGAGDLPSTLPLDVIEEALTARQLPVYRSDDAGGYLCNYLFFLSRGHFCEGFTPSMSGFVHVPPTGADDGRMTGDMLEKGAVLVIESSFRHWMARSG